MRPHPSLFFCPRLLPRRLEEKREYLIYLLEHHLIGNKEVEIEIMHEMFGLPDRSWIFNYFDQRPEEEKEQFRQLFYENMLDAQNRVEAALKVVQSEEEQDQLLASLLKMRSQRASADHAIAGA